MVQNRYLFSFFPLCINRKLTVLSVRKLSKVLIINMGFVDTSTKKHGYLSLLSVLV